VVSETRKIAIDTSTLFHLVALEALGRTKAERKSQQARMVFKYRNWGPTDAAPPINAQPAPTTKALTY
jgi:hypothetical protein